MSKNLLKTSRVIMPAIVGCVLVIGWSNKPVFAQHAGHAGHQTPSPSSQSPRLKASQGPGASPYRFPLPSDYQTQKPADHQYMTHGTHTAAYAPIAQQAPHGGQIKVASPFTFEVVYQPQEIRLYVYGPDSQGVSARDIRGEITFQVRNAAKTVSVPLQYVAQPVGSSEQDYLAAKVDLSKIKNGDMTVSFKLDNLPDSKQSKAAFTQTFALTKVKPKVTLATVSEADRAGIAQQKVCPVMGVKLGSMGAPIKVLVGDQPLYLCCEGCLGKLKSDPEKYLAKVKQSHTNH